MANYLQSVGLVEIIPVIYKQSIYAVHSTTNLSLNSKVSKAYELFVKSLDFKVKPLVRMTSFPNRKRSTSHGTVLPAVPHIPSASALSSLSTAVKPSIRPESSLEPTRSSMRPKFEQLMKDPRFAKRASAASYKLSPVISGGSHSEAPLSGSHGQNENLDTIINRGETNPLLNPFYLIPLSPSDDIP
jgi:hypothetical protein